MNRPLLVFALVLLAPHGRAQASATIPAGTTAGTPATTPAADDDERLHVIVVHTNDVHGQMLTRKATWLDKNNPPEVGGLPRVAAYVNRARADAEAKGDGLVVVDGGDWYQGTPEGLLDDGMSFVKALVLVGYDAMSLGNHEFDHGVENVRRLVRDAQIPVVCANIDLKANKKPLDWLPPYKLVDVHGHGAKGSWTIKLAIVGLVTPVTPDITDASARTLDFQDPSQALKRVAAQLKGKVDWILPITHLGVDGDRELARSLPELPLIVGGHSHTFLKEGVREGATCIVQTGSKAGAVGRVELWFDPTTKKAGEVKARVIDLKREADPKYKNAKLEELCKGLQAQTEERMQAVVGETSAPLERSKDPLASGTAGNFIADVLREHTRADVGLMNRGGIRVDLPAGKLTRRDVFELSPFDNSVTVLTMKGAQLSELLRRSVEGAAHSGLEISGIEVEIVIDAAQKHSLGAVLVGGKPLKPDAQYKVATNSFVADGGDAYLDQDNKPPRKDEPLFVRELLESWVSEKGHITPSSENRYVVRKH